MEPILDETTLVPCSSWSPATRLNVLAKTLQAFDALGAPRVIRSVRDAMDRDIGSSRGMRFWCFERATNKDAGRLIASRLGKQPFIDGDGGLFSAAEEARAVEATAHGVIVFGLGLAALTDGIVIALGSATATTGSVVHVELRCIDDNDLHTESADVRAFVEATEVVAQRPSLLALLDSAVTSGAELMKRIADMYPRLRFGIRAHEQIVAMTGTEPVFRQLQRHLRALDWAARDWAPGGSFVARGITFSQESKTTLEHGTFGPMRDFPVPVGFVAERFSMHTKLTGGNGARLYFRPERMGDSNVVLIGYFGEHLSTVKFRG
jgi:hypothetical protein